MQKAKYHSPNFEAALVSFAIHKAQNKRAAFFGNAAEYLRYTAEGTAQRVFTDFSSVESGEKTTPMTTDARIDLSLMRFSRIIKTTVWYAKKNADAKVAARDELLQQLRDLAETEKHAELISILREGPPEARVETFAFSRGAPIVLLSSHDLAYGILWNCNKRPLWPVC